MSRPGLRNRPRRAERGMTLAELLVALTLLGMLSLMMMGGLNFGARAWERTQERSDETNATLRLHAFLRARLAETPRPEATTGEAERLSFTALWMTALGGGGLYEFTLSHRAGAGLVLAWTPADMEDEEPPEELVGERVLLPDADGLSVSWFGQPPGRPAPEWLERWEPDWPAARLVRIEVAPTRPGRTVPTLTVGLPAER